MILACAFPAVGGTLFAAILVLAPDGGGAAPWKVVRLPTHPEACAFCSCVSPDYPDPAIAVTEARDSAEAVFLGEVVEIRTPGGTLCDRAEGCSDAMAGAVAPVRPSHADVTVELSIERAWKGVAEDQRLFALTTSVTSATCGFPFEVGRAYLVYAQDYESSGVHSTNICTRTQPAEDAGFDLEVLGR